MEAHFSNDDGKKDNNAICHIASPDAPVALRSIIVGGDYHQAQTLSPLEPGRICTWDFSPSPLPLPSNSTSILSFQRNS